MKFTTLTNSLLQYLHWTHKSYVRAKAISAWRLKFPTASHRFPLIHLISSSVVATQSWLLPSVFLRLTPATEVHKNIFQNPLARTKGSEYTQGWRMIQSLWVLRSWYPFRNHWKECQQAVITMVLPGRWRPASTHWISTNNSFLVSHWRKWVSSLAIFLGNI